ncbi:glycoside hydrolase family 88 protein [Bacteroides sp. GD17]|jgi:hypothetical protein|uniref:glycoside hydrolase family 88 protein n=1 Tax=Bacteroides sp. GD17 TaxID=3139826 RepID=UPI0025D1D9C5|nr:glycoside hydrolase family 88 protein [uncultured Bacteroides sp.]
MRKKTLICSVCTFLIVVACRDVIEKSNASLADSIEHSVRQYSLQTKAIDKSSEGLIPYSIDSLGEVTYTSYQDWRSGFFPGSLWYLYALTGNEVWLPLAVKYTEALEKAQYITWHHDIGFIIDCSYLNGFRFGHKEGYKDVLLQAAKSLSTRFRPGAGVIQSWNTNKGWKARCGWQCPVIIDNMMNLELLFEATCLSGDSIYYNMAVSHADKTLKNHFRSDASCYHVVDYDLKTGEVRSRQTAQGYADESAWARGQAWAIYGFTMCYRYTHKSEYLKQACKIYDFIFTHKNLPKDLVPYWDYDALNIPNEPRDASAAAITASALYELSNYVPERSFRETADKIMRSLASSAYSAKTGENGNFILMHSTGSIPQKNEVDVPLSYADYYYLEALFRKKKLAD